MHNGKPIICAFILFASFLSCHGMTTESEKTFLWNEANAAMSSAQSQEEYLIAAQAYQDMADRGIRNGPVFYNMGTALLHAELYAEAVNAFLRAERYMGSHPDLARNLAIAIARKSGADTPQTPWHRIPLFWHFRLSTGDRTILAATVFFLFWILLILRRFGVRRGTTIPGTILIIIFVLLGSSIATSLHQEANAKRFAPTLSSR